MKKFTLAFMAILAFGFSLSAQQYVSTTPANRNVILEEFTGRTCVWCPSGHVIANQIKAQNPDRFWSVNIHSDGYFSATSYPNLNTVKGNQIRAAFNANSFPSGVVNRLTPSAVGRDQWTNQSNAQFNTSACCNVAGFAAINPETRMATITVEVYYTADGSVDENYLTVCMVQDSIWGSQTGGSDNPAQWLNGQYCHMHVFRDIITNTMGDAISPTTQGTLVTRTYEYAIPESIGSPNGVEVDLNNIHFLAWVSERYQGAPTRPILNACELDMAQGTDEPIYPYVKSVEQSPITTCTHSKIVEVIVQNIGTETITAMTINAELEGVTYTNVWEGELFPFGMEKIEMPVEVPFGTHDFNVAITEVNNQPFQGSATGSVSCLEWTDLQASGEMERLKLELMQDKYGNQITWEFTASDGSVIASGGPYDILMGGSAATQIHVDYVNVPTDECVKFTLRDNVGNGICCNSGDGYYIVYDSHNNVVFGDHNDGDFGSEVSHLISLSTNQGEVIVGETEVTNVEESHAEFCASVEYEGYPEEVGFEYRKVTSPTANTVVGFYNEFHKILAMVDDLELASIYMVKAYVIVNGETYYGPDTTFQSDMENVDELDNSLKLYPNPTSSVLNVKCEGMTAIEIYNTVGQCVMTSEADSDMTQINIGSLNNGVYLVRVHLGNGSIVSKQITIVK